MAAEEAQEPEEEPPEAEVVPSDPELAEAVQDATEAAALVVRDPADTHEGLVAMDAHDARNFVAGLLMQAQEQHLGRKWVYRLPGQDGAEGLTGDAVEDIVQQMNWTGRARVGVDPSTLVVEMIDGDEDGRPMKFWLASIAARDEVTGLTFVGTAMEPQRMKLKPGTAKKKRDEGKPIAEDNTVFDKFARTKAVNKAERNALEKHVPTVVKQTLIAIAAGRPDMVERIESTAEEQAAQLPPPLEGPEADALRKRIEETYMEIRELGGGKGAIALPPARYHASLMRATSSLETLRSMLEWLEGRRGELKDHYAKEAGDGTDVAG